MAAYRRAVDQLGGFFAGFELIHVDRRKNEEADALSRLGSKRAEVPAGVFLDHIHSPSIKPPHEVDIAIPSAPDSIMVAAVHAPARHQPSPACALLPRSSPGGPAPSYKSRNLVDRECGR